MVADTLRRSAREASNDVWWRGSQDGCLRDLWTAAGPLDRAATPLCCDGAILLRHADLLPGSVWAIAAQGASADAPSRDGASADAPSREGASADAPSRSDEDVSPCRYCFDAEPRYELVSPCACTGSQAFVHTSCLREWQRLCLTNGDFYKPLRVKAQPLSLLDTGLLALRLSLHACVRCWATATAVSAVLGAAFGAEWGFGLAAGGLLEVLEYVDTHSERDPHFAAAALVTMPLWVGALGTASYWTIVASSVAGGVFGGMVGLLGVPSLAVRSIAWAVASALAPPLGLARRLLLK